MLKSSYLATFTLSFVPTVIPVPTVLVGIEIIAVTWSVVSAVTAAPLALALEIPVATEITPVPAVAPVERATVGWVVTLTPVKQLLVVGVPSAVIADAEEPIVTPVTIESPVPFASVAPVATVTADPALATVLSEIVTLVTISDPPPFGATDPVAAVISVPSVVLVAVTSLPFPPPIINVSESFPEPIVKVHVDLFATTSEFPVTFGIDVVSSLLAVFVTLDTVSVPLVGVILVTTSFLFVSADTDLTNVSVVCAPKPVIAAAVPSAPTAVPLAVALMLVVDGVTEIVGCVTVNPVPVPKTVSVCPVNAPCVTDPLVNAKVVASPNTISPVPLLRVKLNCVSPIFSQL